jgi:transposase
MVSCYEAGYDGFWLHRVLNARGINNHVIDAASLLVSRKARRAKTDRLDAKRLHREREFLMKERVQHIGRIKGLLATQGVYEFQPSRKDWRSRLTKLMTGDGRPFPPRLAAEIDRQCRRLAMVNTMLKEIDEELDNAVVGTVPSVPATNAQRLAQLKGIGSQIATVLAGEVFYRKFKNRRGLGSYLGLTPSPFQSGNMDRDQGITKAGNPRARKISIELAWLWLRYQPQSGLTQWFCERTNRLKGRIRRIIIVAVARKLMVALWRYLDTGLVPKGAELKI